MQRTNENSRWISGAISNKRNSSKEIKENGIRRKNE
jgi:hypothetical protein